MRTHVCLLLALVCLVAGCGSPFGLPDRNLKRTVAESEIIGKWVLTQESLAPALRRGYQPTTEVEYSLVLAPDKTCKFRSLLPEHGSSVYLEAGGKWELGHNCNLGDNVRKANELQLTLNRGAQGTLFFCLCFDERDGKLVLWQFLGDPDSWEFLEYEKAPAR